MSEPEHTPDGHHVVINGRKWRATDPLIPDERRSELQSILMAWRREVKRTKGARAARDGVQAAKVALGGARHPVVGADGGGASGPLGDPGPSTGCRVSLSAR